jgi:hypothetical protein
MLLSCEIWISEGHRYLAGGEGADLFVAAFDLDVGGEGRGVAGDENRDVR